MSLLLNFSRIEFQDSKIDVALLPYGQDGAETLERSRAEHFMTHVFRREGPDKIAAVPIAPNAPQLSSEIRTISLKQNLGLAAALIRNSLLNYLARLGRSVLAYEPIKFIAKDDLLRPCMPSAGDCPDWLAVRLLYEVAVRPIYFNKQKPFIAAIFDVRTTRILDRTVADLLKDGFSPIGHYVARHVNRNADTRLAPRLDLVGRVTHVEGATLSLTDSKDDIATIDSGSVWLEKRAFPKYLAHRFPAHVQAINDRLDEQRANLRSGPGKLHRIEPMINFFASREQEHHIVPGVPFRFSQLMSSTEVSFPELEFAPKPVYIFDQTGSKNDTWHDHGLNQHGPYSAKVFTPNRPRVCVVCQKGHKGQVDEFLHKFLNGIQLATDRRGKPNRNYYEKGLLRKYGLQDVEHEFFVAEDRSAAAYKEACRRAIERHGSGAKWDIALIQIEESFHQLAPKENPYFLAKESFLLHQIPVQEFEIETVRQPDTQLVFALNNMALATYAKLNGIPWLLKANPTIAHELVIGVGSADVASDGRLGGRERYVGITTVFSGDGNYHLSNVSKAVTMDQYDSALLDSLRKAVTKVKQDMNWQPRDHVRLIFHASFKRFSQREIDAVTTLMEELGDYEVEFAFLQLHDQHPYILFDKTQIGFVDYASRAKKGIFAPKRSSYLQLGNRDVLLCLTGASEVKRPEDGIPKPILLSLHPSSSFMDMTYLTRQVFAFSCHSWRTFLPVSVPVTIQYSDLIAKALGNLALLDRWDPDVMLGRIGKTRWFL